MCIRDRYNNGQKEFHYIFNKGILVGDIYEWFENGNNRLKGSFLKGKQNGVWVWYFPNGNPAIEGEYLNGFPKGIWRSFSEDGKMIYQEEDYGLWVEDELKFWTDSYYNKLSETISIIEYE